MYNTLRHLTTFPVLLHVSLSYRTVDNASISYNFSLVFKLMSHKDQTSCSILKTFHPFTSLALRSVSKPPWLACMLPGCVNL